MTRGSFFTTQPVTEWFPLDVACRILSMTASNVLALVQAGRLRGRNVAGEMKIDSVSVDAFTEIQPVAFSAPKQRTFVKIANRCYEEIETASGVTLIPV